MVHQFLSLLLVLLLVVLIGRSASSAQTVSIFGNAAPNNPIADNDARGEILELAARFYLGDPVLSSGRQPGGYVAKLYSADGTLLGSATMAQESGLLPGWQEADFASPIPILANTTYVASYYCPAGQGAWDASGLRQGMTIGPLTAPASEAVGGNGVYNYGNVFPSRSYDASNYYVDVAFAPAAAVPYLVLNLDPPNPNIASNAPLGSIVATIIPSWSDGSPSTGTLAFAPPYSNSQAIFAILGNNLIVNPFGPGVLSSVNTTLNITIIVAQ